MSNKRTPRAKKRSIDGPVERDRTVKKSLYLSEVNAFNLDAVANMSALNGKEWDRSRLVNEALGDWFEAHGYPRDRFIKLTFG